MKITKRKSPKYPIEITLTDGTKMIIPRQSQFDNEWLRKHGCSLMAEYIALQWLGVKSVPVNGKRKGLYPINLLRWHKKHTPDDIAAKVMLTGVEKGIDKLSDGNGKYYKGTMLERMREALDKGHLVIYERKDPIHTVILIPDDGKVWVANHGTVKETTTAKEAKKALKKTKYRGMVVVSR